MYIILINPLKILWKASFNFLLALGNLTKTIRVLKNNNNNYNVIKLPIINPKYFLHFCFLIPL